MKILFKVHVNVKVIYVLIIYLIKYNAQYVSGLDALVFN